MGDSHSLISEVEFIQATRDSGYQSTAAAVAELVDNSLQAGASWVRITVDEEGSKTTRQITLSVLDNGQGMEPAIMQTALQFGGTKRFNDRSGLGRFGMGLPNSSVSQCRRVEVYSWKAPHRVHRTFLDIDEVVAGATDKIPEPVPAALPDWARRSATPTGTLIVWQHCDRLDYRKAATIARKLQAALGRKFRHFLLNGREIFVNDERIIPVDPLFVHGCATLSGATEPFPPLQYWVRAPAAKASAITVRFSLLPVSQWHEWPAAQKRQLGISGGAGVSVVRAGREIAYGWYFMGRKRRQNYDDWWRCEITFEPALDELFGVTHSKQGISPTQELKAFLSPDVERIAHQLNVHVQMEFARVRGPRRVKSVVNAEQKDWMLPQLPEPLSESGEQNSQALYRWRQGLQYRIEVRATAEPAFFTWRLKDNVFLVEINADHPFYLSVYQPLAENGDVYALFHLECLLLSFARSEAQYKGRQEKAGVGSIREGWSHVLAALLS